MKYKNFLLIGSGMLYAAGFPLSNGLALFFLPLIGVTFLLATLFECDSRKKSLVTVLLFAFGHNLLGFYWIAETLHNFGSIPMFFSILLGQLFTLIILPQYLILALLLPWIKKGVSRLPVTTTFPIYAMILTLLEYFTPQQFPAHLGHTWITLAPHLGLAPFFGAPLYSFISFYLIFLFLFWFRQKRIDYIGVVSVALIVITNFIVPFQSQSTWATKEVNLRLVQANIGNLLKLSSERGISNAIRDVEKIYYDLTIKEAKNPIDLIIWPETALPNELNSYQIKNGTVETPSMMKSIINLTNAELLIGGYDLKERAPYSPLSFENVYNTAFFFSKEGELTNLYHKMQLIPFGETVPFGPFTELASQYLTNVSYFARGDEFTLFKTKNESSFITLICYEILFSDFVRTFLKNTPERPEFIVNLTNDSWYGNTSEPFQHLFLAKWRAIEFQMPIVRVTNTGITTIIYPDGKNDQVLNSREAGVLDTKISVGKGVATLFEKFGLIPLLLLATSIFVATFIGDYFSKKRPSFKIS